jgi:hypothetical protein
MKNLTIFAGLCLGFGMLCIKPEMQIADRAWVLGMCAACFLLGFGIASPLTSNQG